MSKTLDIKISIEKDENYPIYVDIKSINEVFPGSIMRTHLTYEECFEIALALANISLPEIIKEDP